jgi:hypothetical protein
MFRRTAMVDLIFPRLTLHLMLTSFHLHPCVRVTIVSGVRGRALLTKVFFSDLVPECHLSRVHMDDNGASWRKERYPGQLLRYVHFRSCDQGILRVIIS